MIAVLDANRSKDAPVLTTAIGDTLEDAGVTDAVAVSSDGLTDVAG